MVNKIKMCQCGHPKYIHNKDRCTGEDHMTDILMGMPAQIVDICQCKEFKRDKTKERYV